MRPRFFSKILLAILLTTAAAAPLFPAGVKKAEARDWGTCGSCYQFFAFSTPGSYIGCIQAELECGGSGECMCRVHAKLAQIYTRDYLFQKELSFWLRFGYGVFVPGVRLIDPDNRAKLADPDVPFYVKSDLVFDKSLVILNVLGLGFGAAAELNNLIGLMNAMSHAMDANEKPADRIVNIMIGTTPYMGGALELYGNALDVANQTKELLQNPDDTEQKAAVPDTSEATTPPVENAPAANLPEVEALAEKAPTEQDLRMLPDEKDPISIRVAKLDGLAEFHLPDGTWIPIEEGDTLPSLGTLQTQYGSTANLHFSDNIIIIVGPLSEFNFKEFKSDPKSFRAKLDLGAGEVRFKILEGDFETDMQVGTPNATASPAGTDFSVLYDKNTSLTISEIYDGSLLITSATTGQQKIISSSYGQPIKRIEIAKDGVMTKQIAIPRDEWQARPAVEQRLASAGSKKSGVWVWAIIFIFVLGGLGYAAYRKRQAITELFRRQNKDGL